MSFVAEQLSRRPLLLAILGFILAEICRFEPLQALWIIVIVLICRSWKPQVWLIGGIILGVVRFIPIAQTPNVSNSDFQGVVSSSPIWLKHGELCEIWNGNTQVKILWTEASAVFLGDRLEIIPKAGPNTSAISDLMLLSGQSRILERGPRWIRLATEFNRSLVKFCHDSILGTNGELIEALALSSTTDLSKSEKSILTKDGSLFLVSASGIHVFILSGLLLWLLPTILVPRVLRTLVLTGLLILYAAATGFHASTVRACVMVAVHEFAYLFNREYDAVSILSLAGLGYLVWQPEALLTPGFQVSMLTVLVLSLAMPLASTRIWASSILVNFWAGLARPRLSLFGFKFCRLQAYPSIPL